MAKSLTIPAIINGDYEQVAVCSLKFHPRNARQGDLGAIIENIKANGFYGACVVQRSTRHVIIGNHRLRAAEELGLPAVPVIWLECDNDRALRLMLSDNQTSDIATNDPNALAELLAELAATEKGLAGTGFDGDALQELIDGLAGPVFEPTGIDEQGRLDEKAKCTCPECGHEFAPS